MRKAGLRNKLCNALADGMDVVSERKRTTGHLNKIFFWFLNIVNYILFIFNPDNIFSHTIT